MAWVSPTGHNDPDSAWINETNAYDENTGTRAEREDIPGTSWSEFLEVTIGAVVCSNVRFWSANFTIPGFLIDLDVYDGSWNDVFQGEFANNQWVEKSFAEKTVTKARVRLYNPLGGTRDGRLHEFDFEVVAAGWTGIVTGVTNPGKIYGIDVANIAKVMGVE